MNSRETQHITENHSVWYYNFKYSKTGVIIALAICALNYFQDFELSRKSIFISFLFSMVITLTITNLIYLSYCLLQRKSKPSRWNIILDFCLMIIGIALATELCYFVIYLVYGNWIPLNKQVASLAFNLFLGFIIGGYKQINTLQKENYELKLKNADYQLTKLNELKTRAELEALQSKINPHFLYNSLNSIASLIHQNANKAEEMVLKLSKLFRYAINSSDENYVSLSYETDIVKTYLDIEAVRLGERLNISIKIEEDLQNECIPRFLLQPLVENAIKHGIAKISTNGLIEVGATALTNNRLKLWVADNGPDFPTEIMPGYGLQCTFDKLRLLYGDDYELNILSGIHKRIQIIIPKFVAKP
ncbi:sensor histidine kinase [Solitalea lacus]|uniref:sensor histidine kinase n=1 Tax=Solitalea lacus TaxID=2911172 RepID=UPI001EDC72D9|nr:histidine kinase [Solitalea lacus]UKJ07874.1 histidine kinase [Solitalea lacus]